MTEILRISAHRRKYDVITKHKGGVHARVVLAKVLLASLEPSEGGWVVLADEVAKLKTQQGKY
eukprot:637680-Pleurochrysis_carterae.AAC.1